MGKTGLPVDTHVVLSSLGVEKAPAQPDLIGDAKRVTEHATQNM